MMYQGDCCDPQNIYHFYVDIIVHGNKMYQLLVLVLLIFGFGVHECEVCIGRDGKIRLLSLSFT